MNENQETNAITGEEGNPKVGENVDWKAKYDELEKKFASVRVEEGRVRKLDEELKARDRMIEELKAAKRTEEIAASLSQEERGDIPDDYLKVAARLVNNGLAKLQAENDRKFSEMREASEARAKASHESAMRNFNERVDAKFPKFRSSIGPGGDKAEAWKSYLRYNRASVVSAYNDGDFDALAHHIETFYRDHLGVPVPSGSQDGSAAPEPVSTSGGATGADANHGKVYTQAEYTALYDQAEAARSRGDYAEMKRISAEIKNALAENRIKGE